GDPVFGRAAVGRRVGPDVEVAVARIARAERVDEPRVAVAGVVGDEVQQHADPARARLRDELVEILERAEVGVHALVVADVVAPVVVGRGERRVEPDAVDPEPLEMVQARGDAAQGADPVAVGIAERPGVDLVEDALAPPSSGYRHGAAGYEPWRLRLVDALSYSVMRLEAVPRGGAGGVTTIARVAQEAGVGVGTVSRVINGSASVSEATRRRRLEVVGERGAAP